MTIRTASSPAGHTSEASARLIPIAACTQVRGEANTANSIALGDDLLGAM